MGGLGWVWRDFDNVGRRGDNPSVNAAHCHLPLHKGGVCHGAAVASGRCTPRVLVPLRSTAWASPPTEGLSGVRSFVVSPSGASRHLPRRGRLDATALPWQRGDAPQGYLFRFAPLRGHRPLRKVCRGLRSVGSGHIFFLMAEMAPFSRRDTWAWEMPISVETSIWVLPWQKRRARMLRWRSSRRAMASLRAM